MFGLGGQELILIGLLILILFGANKIPEFARGLGKGIREFKDAAAGVKEEIEKEAKQVKASSDISSDAEKK